MSQERSDGTVEAEVAAIFQDADCSGSFHAVRLADRSETGYYSDRLEVSASVAKVPIALEFYAQAESGLIDPTQPVTIDASNRTFGPTGISHFQDPATLSLRDLVFLMLTISDNAATEIVKATVGTDAVNARLRRIGCDYTVLVDFRAVLDSLAIDLGFADYPELLAAQRGDLGPQALAESTDQVRIDACRALDPSQTNRTTARDSTKLLTAIWNDTAAQPAACARLRSVMAEQVTRRLGSAVPAGGTLAAKSGGLFGRVANEIAVITHPDGDAYCLAVFTRAHVPFRHRTRINAAMAKTAAAGIAELRSRTGAR